MTNTKTITITGYRIIATIYESANSLVYRAIREQDQQPVILKVLKENYPTPQELTRYKQEYEIIRSLNLDGIVGAYGLHKYQNTLVILLEDFGGESLKILMSQRQFTLKEFLVIAIQAAESLGNIHAAHIIHKDINPSNIVFNPETKQLKIIDFGISTVLSRENPTLKNVNILEGTLAYMSPEQTGRMNCSLDYRTDFYSLGVTFYQLLTDRLPFETTDPLELVHCHLALTPRPVNQINSDIPQAISDIVMKLLAKNAADRYQSAWGIQADLVICLMQLENHGNIENIIPGIHDVSNKFLISQKLYGRDQEVELLLTAFERVSEGKTELMLVSGYSGIGKSALVQEIYKPITRQRGYFIRGKFDQYQRNIPYYALIQACQELIKQLLTESEAQLEVWASQLLAALGANAQVIIDVIPDVELLIGSQQPVIELGPAESQIRFHRVFQKFIRVFSQVTHPLVIFLDDLQWADSATLKLIEQIMKDQASQSLFLIGAYRENEVTAAHPFMLTIDEIRLAGVNVNHIQLLPLDETAINQLIADTLKCDHTRAKPLAELVLNKTQGNPFFVKEFLKSLYTEKLLNFDLEALIWQWDIRQIEASQFTDNVVELMALKIKKLPENTQNVLKLAAAIGNQFELNTLAIVNQKSASETALILHSAVAEGLVLPLSDEYKSIELDINDPWSLTNSSEPRTMEYKFAHDRIQQAAYSLIPESDKQAVHLQIGQLLLSHTPLDQQEAKVFDIVNQLNLGIKAIKFRGNQEQQQICFPDNLAKLKLNLTRHELAELNLIAGKKAKASAAYKAALKYLQIGIKFLGIDSWFYAYNLTWELFVEAAEAAYLSGDFEQQDELVSVVLQQASNLLDQVKVYEVKIQAYIAQNKLKEAVETAIAVLKLLGVKFPELPNQFDIWVSFWLTKLRLIGRKIADLVNLPLMTEPNKLAAMRILSSVVPAAYFAVPKLMPLLVFKQINLSVKYGNAPLSASAYASYGIILCDLGFDIDAGYRFGQLALSLLDRFNIQGGTTIDPTKAKTLANVNFFARPWKEHLNATLHPLLEAYSSGLETGDLEAAAYAAHNYCLHSYFVGKELSKLQEEITTYGDVLSQLKQERTFRMNKLYRQVIVNLRQRMENPGCLTGDLYNEFKMLPQHQTANDLTAVCVLHFNKMILCYLFESYQQAAENATTAEKYLAGLKGTVIVPIFYFYDSLVRLELFAEAPRYQQKLILKKIADNQKKIQQWSAHAPMNHLHKFYLVEAERYRVIGQLHQAADCYDRAIELAQENEYPHEQALANQLAAKFYLRRGKNAIARSYMQDAHYGYLQWGATAKVQDLETRYPQLITATELATQGRTTTSSTTSTGSVTSLDLATVMNASQAISGEIVLEHLLAKLMKMLIQNAGAQKGILILSINGKLLIEAEGSVDAPEVRVLQSIPVSDQSSVRLPLSMINYVARTKETLVLNDATRESSFIQDAYVKSDQPRSVLCCPLVNQSKLTGIIYLENNLTTAAFTQDRLEVLKLLSSQAAISIENAKLYSERLRFTQELEAKNAALQEIDQLKDEFLKTTSHELRTPLNGIISSLRLILDDFCDDRDEEIELLMQADRCAIHLLNIIDQVLDLAKIKSGQLAVDIEPVNLTQVLSEAIDLHLNKLEQKRLRLYRHNFSDSLQVLADFTKFKQVLINIIENAIKFTDSGSITISTGILSPGKQGTTAQTTVAFVRIQDTGIGIDPSQKHKLFKPFLMLDGSTTRSQGGIGLGLVISRNLLEMMKGSITIESAGKGQGAIVQIVLPLMDNLIDEQRRDSDNT